MLSGWSHVIVRDDMEILVGGRLYGLCSESARFRADVLSPRRFATPPASRSWS
ncbi:MAG: hypothetical protein IPK20_26165 [Betaproteobacteria bacterium]|nr:hypothetical protein [Betaproteobacteria bacterium]